MSPVVFFAFFVTFKEKKPPIIKFYGVLTIFHELVKLQRTIKLYLSVSDVMHANEQTKYVNCGLHINFWNFK